MTKKKSTCDIGLGCGLSCVDAKKHCAETLGSSPSEVLGKATGLILKTHDGSEIKDDYSARSLKRSKDFLGKWHTGPDSPTEPTLARLYGTDRAGLKPYLNADNAKVVIEFSKQKDKFNSDLRSGKKLDSTTKAMVDHLDHALYRLPSVGEMELHKVAKFTPELRNELLDKYASLMGKKGAFTDKGFLQADDTDPKVGRTRGVITYHYATAGDGSKAKDISEYSAPGTPRFAFSKDASFDVVRVDKKTGEVWLKEQGLKAETKAEAKAEASVSAKSLLPEAKEQKKFLDDMRSMYVHDYGKEKVDKLESSIQDVVNKAKIAIMIRPDNLLKILEPDGRFKNVLELSLKSDSAKGDSYNEYRLAHEAHVLGFPESETDHSKRPIYGFLSDSSREGSHSGATGYGAIQVNLKSEAKQRATVTDDDSFSTNSKASPVSKINIATFNDYSKDALKDGAKPKNVSDMLGTFWRPYLEVQVYGKVDKDSFESVGFPSGVSNSGIEQAKKILAGYGISYYDY